MVSGGMQSSSQNSYGYSNSLAQSLSRSQQNVWGAQAPQYRELFDRGRQMFDYQREIGAPLAQGYAQHGMRDIQGAMDQVQGMIGPNAQLVGDQIDMLTQNMQQQWDETIMPSIGQDQILSGWSAGGRTAPAIEGAARGWSQGLSEGITGIMENDAARRLTAAAMIPDMATARMGMGLGGLSSAWLPMQSFASLLGRPLPLNDAWSISQARSNSEDWSSGRSSGFNFGLSLG